MSSHRRIVAPAFVGCFLCCFGAVTASARVDHMSADLHSDGALLTALQSGNRKQLKDAETQQLVPPILKQLFSTQLRYDLPKLYRVAIKCQLAEYKLGNASAAAYCNAVAFSAAYRQGDAKGTFNALEWAATHAPSASEAASWKKLTARDLHPNLGELARALPRISVNLMGRPTSIDYLPIPLKARQKHESNAPSNPTHGARNAPVVDAAINGHRERALLDTGSPSALTLSTHVAAALGLKVIRIGTEAFDAPAAHNIGKYQMRNVHLVVIKQFRLGGMEIDNLMAVVLPNGYSRSPVTVGLPLLARFGSITFRKSSVVIGNVGDACKRPIPLTFASGALQGGKLTFPATADGMGVTGTLDTGSAYSLIAVRELAHDGDPDTTSIHDQSKWSSGKRLLRAYLAVAFGGDSAYQISATSVPEFPGIRGLGPSVFVGWPIVNSWNVHMGFSPPYLCLVRRGG